MTDLNADNTMEPSPPEQPTSISKQTQAIGIAIGAVVMALCGFFIGYAVHGSSGSTSPTGSFPGGGQFPGGVNGELPGNGQFPGGVNGGVPADPPAGNSGVATSTPGNPQ